MTIIESYKKKEALELKDRGLLMAFTVPLSRHDPVLTTWKNYLKSVGASYLVTQKGKGCVILKERKDFRCKHCGHFLNARPQKYKHHLTHKMVGRECVASQKRSEKCNPTATKL
jgi:hypothetical protein